MSPRIPSDQLAAWVAFVAAHSAVIGRIEQRLAGEGLPPLGWYDVLWSLYRAPEKRLRINRLGEEVLLSRTALVRLVDRIERAGLLVREPVPEDGRGIYAAITPAGVEVLRRMWPCYAQEIRGRFLLPLGDDLPQVRGALERIRDAARQDG